MLQHFLLQHIHRCTVLHLIQIILIIRIQAIVREVLIEIGRVQSRRCRLLFDLLQRLAEELHLQEPNVLRIQKLAGTFAHNALPDVDESFRNLLRIGRRG